MLLYIGCLEAFMDLKYLKSGTDIRGVALGEYNKLTDDVIKKPVFWFC